MIKKFELEELTIAELQAGMEEGRWSAQDLVTLYLKRIEGLEKGEASLHHVISLNRNAMRTARELDRERRNGNLRGPLHGIPILVKDNIHTVEMRTTSGSMALSRFRPAKDAFLVDRLRRQGAIILAKSNLTEWAGVRSWRAIHGWSAVGGLGRNPYALDRSSGGSSSGTAAGVAANYAAAGVGTDTGGSITWPASVNGVVGIRPTVGLVSRTGMVPAAGSRDTPGPIARTVEDAAILLDAMKGFDPLDRATGMARGRSSSLPTHGSGTDLKGFRIGVVRVPGSQNIHSASVYEAALLDLRRLGASIIDPIEIPPIPEADSFREVVLMWELRSGLDRYLSECGPKSPVRSLEALIKFNEKNRKSEMRYFGQETFEACRLMADVSEGFYKRKRRAGLRFARDLSLDLALKKNRLQAILVPACEPARRLDLINGEYVPDLPHLLACDTGYPSITVPAGFRFGLPVGITFVGTAWSEPMLINLARAFESATQHRRPPKFLPSASVDWTER